MYILTLNRSRQVTAVVSNGERKNFEGVVGT